MATRAGFVSFIFLSATKYWFFAVELPLPPSKASKYLYQCGQGGSGGSINKIYQTEGGQLNIIISRP
jgi:hypothetical protein